MKALTYEKTPVRTKLTKEIERGLFKDLSTASILFGTSRELYRRFDIQIWVILAVAGWGWAVWRYFNG